MKNTHEEIQRGLTGVVSPGSPEKRNTIQRFNGDTCFPKIMKSWFLLLDIIINKNKKSHTLNLLLLIGASTF
jgi:hypothetical protein